MESLKEWSARTGIPVQRGDDLSVFVTVDHFHPDRKALWALRDCRVSSVMSSTVFLILTPYAMHEQNGHKMTRCSPNGVDIIEECPECGARFLHNPCIGYPVTMPPLIKKERV